MITTLNLPIVQRSPIAKDIIEVVCKQDKKLSFKPGQHVKITLDRLAYNDPKGNSRTFNVVSSPNNAEYLGFAFMMSDSGFKKTLMALPLNSKIEIKGPYGGFTLPDTSTKPIVLITDKIGITPCVSIALYAAEEQLRQKITIIYQNESTNNSPYLNQLEELGKENPNFNLKIKNGPIDQGFIKKNIEKIENCIWYISGLPTMVALAYTVITKLKIPEKDIRTEIFTGY